jgi:hypothetical protein
MCQPVDEVDVILGQHDIIEVLAVLGDIEAQAEFFPDIASDSPFEEQEEKINLAEESSAPQCSFLGHDEEIYVRMVIKCVESDRITQIDGLDEGDGFVESGEFIYIPYIFIHILIFLVS